MNDDDDDDEKKRFSDFAETWVKESSGRITKSIITVKRENFLMGLKIDFSFSRSDNFIQDFQLKKIIEGFPLEIGQRKAKCPEQLVLHVLC